MKNISNKPKLSYKRSSKRTYWVDVITVCAVILIVVIGSYFTIKSVKKDTELELASIRQEGIIKASNDELSRKIDNVDNELSDFKISIVNEFTSKYNTQQSDIEEINKYISTLSTKEELTSFKTNVEAEMKKVDETMFNSVMHRNIYRGKNLGTSITNEQLSSIRNGSFNDLYVGDYWIINNTKYILTDINYFRGLGDQPLSKNHIVVTPADRMYFASMSDKKSTQGGYANSLMRKSNLQQSKDIIFNDFGRMNILTHREFLINSVDSNGKPTGGDYYDCDVELMSEVQLFGHHISGFGYRDSSTNQFSLYRLAPIGSLGKSLFWLRDTINASYFVTCDGYRSSSYQTSNVDCGVKPYFLIG